MTIVPLKSPRSSKTTDPLSPRTDDTGYIVYHPQLSDAELEDQGIRQNTIRLSIGTEHIDDILEDLEKGFSAVRGELA